MNEFNVLWIDDVWDDVNHTHYNNLNDVRCEIIDGNPNIQIRIIGKIGDAVTLLSKDDIRFDFVIVDLKYENDINPELDFSYTDIVRAILQKQLKFCVFSDAQEVFSQEYDVKKFLFGLYNKSEKNRLVKDIIQFSQFTPINFVHLSDFHYDSTLTKNQKEEQTTRFNKLNDFLSKQNSNKQIDFIIFSGDFANKDVKNDLSECSEYIRKLIKASLKNGSDRFFIVPGNHDIVWDDFEKGEISKTPCASFYEFYKKIYDYETDHVVISGLTGYNQRTETFDTNYSPDSFLFSRKVESRVSILGLNSVMTEKNHKGQGIISEQTANFVSKEWEKKSSKNEFRIAVFHHNLLPPFSINQMAEKGHILNSGNIIEVLSKKGCDLVLSGHCHDSYYYNFSYSTLEHSGFSAIKNLAYISTGTSGGYASTADRARSFNIIKIYPTKDVSVKELHVIPVVYDSSNQSWIEITAKSLITEIRQSLE